jgi:imidazole glycerol-phosphate synthase subunit HisF
MLAVRLIPCLLLKNAGLVKTVRFKDPSYVGDPVNAIRIFNEKEVDELIFLDIRATVDGKQPPFKMIGEIASECFMPVTYGGGIKSLDDIRQIFGLGIEKVSLNSYATEHPEFVTAASERFGSQSIVASIDARRARWKGYRVYSHGGAKNTGLHPVEWAQTVQRAGAGEILLNSIDQDGTMAGYDLELIRQVTNAVSIPVVAAGGAGQMEDCSAAVGAGASAAAAGSMVVYHGRNRAVLINFPTRDEQDRAFART